MSGAACKEVLCLANAASTAQQAMRQVIRGDYDKEESNELRVCAEKFIKDVMRIAEG